MRVGLGMAIAFWTLAAWGGRIGLLTTGDGLGDWLRIGGSVVIGLGTAATLLSSRLQAWRKPVLVVFAWFTILLWVRSLIVNWGGDGSLPFKLVHTFLALGFFALAWWALSFSRAIPGRGPDSPAGARPEAPPQ